MVHKVKDFLNNVLQGTAIGVIIGVIPYAVLGAVLKIFSTNAFAMSFRHNILIFQLGTPLIIGTLIALQFKLKPLQMLSVGGAAFCGSGVVKFNPQTQSYVGAGTGDIINTMITAALAVLIVFFLKNHFGSVEIILTPIVVGSGVGLVGYYLYPYTTKITSYTGSLINTFTSLQPVLMSILIACSFSILVISPISTVALGMAIQLNGISAGAAAMGVAATMFVLVVNSLKVNKIGVTIALALGSMKMMMPNLFKHPIIMLPCLITASISAIFVALFSISGVPDSAGFGLVGLVGPLASIAKGLSLPLAFVFWFLIPLLGSLLTYFLFYKLFKFYNPHEAFKFLG